MLKTVSFVVNRPSVYCDYSPLALNEAVHYEDLRKTKPDYNAEFQQFSGEARWIVSRVKVTMNKMRACL